MRLYPQLWYRFSVRDLWKIQSTMDGSIADGSDYNASYTLWDNTLKPRGSFPGSSALQPGNYYLKVAASSKTKFHFGFVLEPSITSFSNDAGRTAATALDLGMLRKAILHSNEFYTFYKRNKVIIDDSAEPGTLKANFDNPNPNPPVQVDYYTFECAARVDVKFFTFGTKVTYILSDGITQRVLSGDQIIHLEPQRYELRAFDSETTVVGTVTSRLPHSELYEPYQFEILIP
jgi:hypothetical protein